MKRYLNKSKQMTVIKFADGSAQFLFANQKIDTDKKVSSLGSGVVEVSSPKARPKNIKKTAEKPLQEQPEAKEDKDLDTNGDK